MSRLVRSICAVLCGAGALLGGTGANAQSALLYGLIDVSASSVKPVGGETTQQLDSGDMQRSFLGFRGTEDLGGGLRAVYKLESYLRVDTGAVGRNAGDTFWRARVERRPLGRVRHDRARPRRSRRSTWRRSTSIRSANRSASRRARASTSARAARCSATAAGTTRSTTPTTPRDSPLRLNVAASLAPTGRHAAARPQLRAAACSYITGPFAATLACEKIKNSARRCPPASTSSRSLQVGATYDFKFLRVYGQVGRVKTEADIDVQTILYQIGAAIPIGTRPDPGRLRPLAPEVVAAGDDRPHDVDRLRLLPVEEHRRLRRGAVREAELRLERQLDRRRHPARF